MSTSSIHESPVRYGTGEWRTMRADTVRHNTSSPKRPPVPSWPEMQKPRTKVKVRGSPVVRALPPLKALLINRHDDATRGSAAPSTAHNLAVRAVGIWIVVDEDSLGVAVVGEGHYQRPWCSARSGIVSAHRASGPAR
jgi:hypothetical protein